MSQKFKKGDLLECVNNDERTDTLTVGKVYPALCDTFLTDIDKDERIKVTDDKDDILTVYPSRFTLHTPKQSTMPESNPMKDQIEAQIVDLQRELSRVEYDLEGVDNRIKEAAQYLKAEEQRQRDTAAKCDRLRAIISLLNSHL